MLKIGTQWYDSNLNFYRVMDLWYVAGRDLWVKYTNQAGQEFSCRAEAFVNRFSYTAVK